MDICLAVGQITLRMQKLTGAEDDYSRSLSVVSIAGWILFVFQITVQKQ